MSRPASRDNSTAVSLFPFLAVLLCTMGALIVLLVVMAQAASRRAEIVLAEQAEQAEQTEKPGQAAEPVKEVAPAAVVPQIDPNVIQAAADELQLAKQRAAELASLEQEAARALRDEQAKLANIEDHTRRLKDELVDLYQAERQLKELEESYTEDQSLAKQELERLQELIAESEATIEDLKDQQVAKKTSYAIIPFEGGNHTYRRPLYIECLKDRVVIQPEGTVLLKNDFRGPLGVGNPLNAVLRAARKYYVQQASEHGDEVASEPYPLVIGRPESLELYNVVVQILELSDLDYGYELIDEQWELEYPLPNAELAKLEQEAVVASRLRRSVLARAAPNAYRGRSQGGGIGGLGGDSPLPGGDSADGLGQGGQGTAAGLAPYSADDTPNYSDTTDDATFAGGGESANSGVANQGSRELFGSPGENSPTDRLPQQNEFGSRTTAGQGAESSHPPSSSPNSFAAGLSVEAGNQPFAGTNGQSPPFAAESGSPNASSEKGADAATQQASNSSSSGGAGGDGDCENCAANSAQNAAPSPAGSSSRQISATATAAGGGGASRGRSSSQPRHRPGDIAIRRTIPISVYSDRVVMTPVDSHGKIIKSAAVSLPMRGPTSQHLRELVNEVGNQIESWGIAGSGCYWKPSITLNVADGGANRAHEIATVFKRSGVEVRLQNSVNISQQEKAGALR